MSQANSRSGLGMEKPHRLSHTVPCQDDLSLAFRTLKDPTSVTSPGFDRDHLWAIVLAGGEGERLRPLTENWLGCHRPKQYCTFVGNRSMLQHTLDRTCQVVDPNRVLTIISRDHVKWLRASINSSIAGRVLMQPSNLDTGPGIFFPATVILAADPSATVLIFPSDHFVFPEQKFLSQVRRLAEMADTFQDRIVLLGVKPNRPEADYGWIKPGSIHNPDELIVTNNRNPARRVEAFKEKPSREDAENYLQRGYLWNTMIMAVRVQTLWKLGRKFLPAVVNTLEPFAEALTSGVHCYPESDLMKRSLLHTYRSLKPENFSKGLLQLATEHTVFISMEDVLWDDWGRPDRIVKSLAQIGHTPAFLGRLQRKGYDLCTESNDWRRVRSDGPSLIAQISRSSSLY